MLAVIGSAALVSACAGPGAGGVMTAEAVHIGRAQTQSRADATQATGAGRSTGSPTSVEVVTAWVAAQRAFDDAARTADAGAPELAATMVAPQLPWTQSLLEGMRASGEESRGPVSFGEPRVDLQAVGPSVVRACVHDSEIAFSVATGRPVAGPAGQADFELFTSIMERADGGWKLETQSVTVGACGGG